MIVAQTLVGQFSEPFLDAALHSVSWVDHHVVVNTHPGHPVAEENVRIARAAVLRDKLTVLPYHPGPEGFSFAEARNLALAQVDLTDSDPFVLWLDADDIHAPELVGIVHHYLRAGADSISGDFYHLVVYRDAVQAVFPRELVYRVTPTTQWVGAVHEKLMTPRSSPVVAEYRWFHASYIRGQRSVFDRWKFYSDLVGDSHHYDGQNPDTIIEDRVTVARRLEVDWPEVASGVIDQVPVCPHPLLDEPPFPEPRIGLVLIVHPDDPLTPPAAVENVQQNTASTAAELYVVDGSEMSLAKALNEGFDHYRRRGFDYVGWVHPDMRFDDPAWLDGLLYEMRCWPKVAKVCAANTRDALPARLIDGHEQCYIMRCSVLDEVGLFDEQYAGIGGYEDWDLHRRILNAGYRVCISPRARVFHAGMGTRSRRDTTADQLANAARYHAKWGTAGAPV